MEDLSKRLVNKSMKLLLWGLKYITNLQLSTELRVLVFLSVTPGN